MNNTYFVLRHGQTPYQTEEKRGMTYPWPEYTPVPLTGEGIEEAKKAAKKIKEEGIDLIYSSDAFRTKKTAEIVAEETDSSVILDKRLRDINLGDFKGSPRENFYLFFSSQKERFSKAPLGGESWNDLKERMKGFLYDIDKKYKNKKILIVTHGDPIWILEGISRNLSNEELLEKRKKGLFPKTAEFRKLTFKK